LSTGGARLKLYLSSYRLGSEPERLRALVGRDCRAAIIFNACDGYPDRLRVYEREAADLAGLGFVPEELDLREFFSEPGDLQQQLSRFGLVWVVGGNTFVLARAMNASGFPSAARILVETGRLTYAGYSAGACITGPDLDGIHVMDEPDALPMGYTVTTSTDSLRWIPWRVVPHWRSDHPESDAAEAAVAYMTAHALEHRVLTDGDVIVIDN